MTSTRRPGAPPGNLNALKHGFYTRRLVESCLPDADSYALADTLRILCLASSTITRLTRTQYLLSNSNTGLDDEIAEAIRRVNAELRPKLSPTSTDAIPPSPSPPPSYLDHQPVTSKED